MQPFPIVENEQLLKAALKKHPEFEHGSVCSCRKVLPTRSMAGHISGSNRKWTIKAKTKKGKRFEAKHEVVGYTLVGRES